MKQMEKQLQFSKLSRITKGYFRFKKRQQMHIKCKNAEKHGVCMPCRNMVLCWTCVQDPSIVDCIQKRSLKNSCVSMLIAEDFKV